MEPPQKYLLFDNGFPPLQMSLTLLCREGLRFLGKKIIHGFGARARVFQRRNITATM
jgi:hypothetical protein